MSTSTSKIDQYLDRENVVETRLGRLDYYAAIFSGLWSMAALFYLQQGVPQAAVTCGLGSLVSILLFVVSRRYPKTGPFAANLFICATVLTLCGCNLYTGQSQSYVTQYFPIVVILAAQIVGLKGAVAWSLCLIAVIALGENLNLSHLSEYIPTKQDRIFNTVWVTCVALWLAFESEKFFNVQTRNLHELAESLKEKTRLLELAEKTAGVGHWRWNFASDSVSMSTEARIICKVDSATKQPESLASFINVWGEKHREDLQDRLTKAKQLGLSFNEDLSFETAHELRHVSCCGLCERDRHGNVIGVFGTIRDDTQLRAATDRLARKAEQLNKLASFDPLTGLTNRFQFQQQLGRIVARAVNRRQQMALLVLDMDGFKEINDSLGHQTGDEVLKVVAQRLEEIVRTEDVISRLGGDEFTVILRDAENAEEVEAVARRIVKSIAAPMSVNDQELHVGVSIGSSLCPKDSTRPDELFTFADTAMYEAKSQKKGIAMYTSEMTAELRKRRSDESRLAGAMSRNEFRLVYQPQYNIRENRILGFECLLRWKNAGKDVPPLKFIPLLEGNGKIIDVGQWVLEQSFKQVAKWQSRSHNMKMAINISPLQFREDGFAERVIDTIAKFDVDPSWIELEITEGLLIQDLDNTADKLFKLKAHGLRISVDDFGTGYSSLAYLKHLPIDQLKIDRGFIKDIPDHDDGTIASSIIVLGQSLDMDVLAEGVETQAQLDFLAVQDCDSFQGNYANPPLEPDACDSLLSRLTPICTG